MVITTGIPGLDDVLGGGLKANTSMLICARPGVESLQFAQQLLYTQLKKGIQGLYLVNNKRVAVVNYIFEKYGWDISSYKKNDLLYFIDAYSAQIAQESESSIFIDNPADIKAIKTNVSEILRKLKAKNKLYIIDNLSTMLDMCGTDTTIIEEIKDHLDTVKTTMTNTVGLLTAWHYPKPVITKLRDIFDYVLDLKLIEHNLMQRYYFTLSKGGQVKDIPFVVECPGGIKVYIPKILVTGAYNAGKTSFVHSVSAKAVSVDRLGTTVALDHGHVDYHGFSVDLWGTPGQDRFNPILKMIGNKAIGVVIVVDSTDPKSFVKTKDMIRTTESAGLPQVIVANKADFKGAIPLKDIQKMLKIPKSMPIIPVTAAKGRIKDCKTWCQLNKDDTEKVLKAMFDMLL